MSSSSVSSDKKDDSTTTTVDEVKVDIELSTTDGVDAMPSREDKRKKGSGVTNSGGETEDDESHVVSCKREDSMDSGYASGYANTVELMPNVDNYLYNAEGTVQVRPGYKTVIAGQPTVVLESRLKAVEEVKQTRAKLAEQKRFGTFDGVVARCLLNIWGVIMFLRMGFVSIHSIPHYPLYSLSNTLLPTRISGCRACWRFTWYIYYFFIVFIIDFIGNIVIRHCNKWRS